MTEQEKLKHCQGCRDDFYNQGDNSTTGRCWKLPDMKLVWRKEILAAEQPPWTQKAKRVPACYSRVDRLYIPAYQKY
jgi:hypothetical protein